VLQGTLTARTNVFSVTAECLATATSFTIDAPAGATVLVNIRPSGTSGYALTLANFMMFRQGGIVPSGILLNALEATSVTMSSFQLDGSLLAPNAAVSFSNGNLLGTLVADSLQGNGQFHSHPLFSICAGSEADPVPGMDDT
jgi:choice-of-anchor A domain-containing protein